MSGEVQVIYGPMFSGKSTELLRRIRRYTAANKSCIVLKYCKDTRYEQTGSISTHDLITWQAHAYDVLESAMALVANYDVIGIDEGQFFKDIVEFSDKMANEGKIVIVAALDATFERKDFNHITALLPIAEQVTKLNAICELCYGTAAFSKRLGQETEIELIGGHDKYIAVCRACYFK